MIVLISAVMTVAFGIEVPHFRQSLRNHLGGARNWLNNSNGRGHLDGELYLWSYRKSEWYLYDPNWWR